MVEIRAETRADIPAIHEVNALAFPAEDEANLVDALRERAAPIISLVAADGERIVGHILFTPVELDANPSLMIMGLGPMGVVPDRQRCGIGSQLVREGLARCEKLGAVAAVVLGHPDYYPRFGFATASARNIRSEYEAPDEAFMIIELAPGLLPDIDGTIRYHAAFRETTEP